jgi:hypothetical protein
MRAVDQYNGHVDPTKVVYVGHELGAAAALAACRGDEHCSGAVSLSGSSLAAAAIPGPPVSASEVSGSGSGTNGSGAGPSHLVSSTRSPHFVRPLLLLNSGSAGAARAGLGSGFADRGPVWAYTIGGAGELSFTDYAVYGLAWPVRKLLPLGSLNGREGLSITTGYLDAFLATCFRGTPWHAPSSPSVRADEASHG